MYIDSMFTAHFLANLAVVMKRYVYRVVVKSQNGNGNKVAAAAAMNTVLLAHKVYLHSPNNSSNRYR